MGHPFPDVNACLSSLHTRHLPLSQILLQLARHIGELPLLQLRLPEDGVRVVEPVLDPSFLLDVVQVDVATRVSVPVRRSKDAAAAQLQRILDAQVVVVLRIQHTVGKCLATAHAEKVASQTGAVAVDVVQRRALLRGHTSTHSSHAQAHALVAVHEVGKDLAGGGDADAALVTELVKTALHAQPREPVLAVGGATGHGAEKDRVDLDDLLDRLRRDPVAGRGSRIGGDDDAALEAEGERGCAVGDLDGAVGVGAVVGSSTEPLGGLERLKLAHL